jgi:dTDP-4-dehydrorhamnose reductase
VSAIAVLGSTGMLGSCLSRVLANSFDDVIEVNRTGVQIVKSSRIAQLNVLDETNLENVFSKINIEYIVNAVGLIKQHINHNDPADQFKAREVNTIFPSRLEKYADYNGIKVIQIGTDCVFDGAQGSYSENDKFNAEDLYGRTKSDGEKMLKSTMTIRSSIVGRELNSNVSLLNWFLSQPERAIVEGFTNHYWNGVTTLAFANVVRGVIEKRNFKSGSIHLVPGNKVSKYELLNEFRSSFERSDIEIKPVETEKKIDRTLRTLHPEVNSTLWRNAGYNCAPDVAKLVGEFAEWCKFK